MEEHIQRRLDHSRSAPALPASPLQRPLRGWCDRAAPVTAHGHPESRGTSRCRYRATDGVRAEVGVNVGSAPRLATSHRRTMLADTRAPGQCGCERQQLLHEAEHDGADSRPSEAKTRHRATLNTSAHIVATGCFCKHRHHLHNRLTGRAGKETTRWRRRWMVTGRTAEQQILFSVSVACRNSSLPSQSRTGMEPGQGWGDQAGVV